LNQSLHGKEEVCTLHDHKLLPEVIYNESTAQVMFFQGQAFPAEEVG